jgi:hypothetical protein
MKQDTTGIQKHFFLSLLVFPLAEPFCPAMFLPLLVFLAALPLNVLSPPTVAQAKKLNRSVADERNATQR